MSHTNTTTTTNTRRGRQAIAFGAGIVATLTAGFVLAATNASADGVEGEATFVPITPCRLFDTRPAPDNVGARSTPLGADETMIQQVTGTNGNCDIPAEATAVALNATAVGATAPSFGTFYPADAPLPDSSNLNFGPGQAATPNKVDVKLSNDGKIAIFNKFGNVDMIGDVTGYYRSDGLTALRNEVAQLSKLVDHDPLAPPKSYSRSSEGISDLPAAPTPVAQLAITPDDDGFITAHYSALASSLDTDGVVRCGLAASSEIAGEFVQVWQAGDGAGPFAGSLAGTRRFSVNSGSEVTIRLLCERSGAAITNIANAQLTAAFTAHEFTLTAVKT